VLVPLVVWLLPRPAALVLLGAGVVAALLVEGARRWSRWARYHFLTRTRTLLRAHERRRMAGATWMALAYFLALLLFPKAVAVLAMLYAALGDAAAALVGRRWGRHRAPWGKSAEGLAAAFAVMLALGWAMPGVPLAAAVVGAAVAALLEFLPLPLDDNLVVVLGGGAAVWGVMLLTAHP
jgi:dolichol kinase